MNRLLELDRALAEKYGSYASYPTATDPIFETHNDGPAAEVDRLLDCFVNPDVTLLDLGSGAGQTLCRLAPKVKAIWGVNQEADLHEAAQLRVASLGIENASERSGGARTLRPLQQHSQRHSAPLSSQSLSLPAHRA